MVTNCHHLKMPSGQALGLFDARALPTAGHPCGCARRAQPCSTPIPCVRKFGPKIVVKLVDNSLDISIKWRRHWDTSDCLKARQFAKNFFFNRPISQQSNLLSSSVTAVVLFSRASPLKKTNSLIRCKTPAAPMNPMGDAS